jgi:hypothetical protein
MKLWAAAVIAVLPTEGRPSLIVRDPPAAKNTATLAAFWLHHAVVYLVPNFLKVALFIADSVELSPASAAATTPRRPPTRASASLR